MSELFDCPPSSRRDALLPVGNGRSIPVKIINGSRPGRTLVISAAVHGCEYVGIEALRRLYRTVNPAELSGRLILLPLVNEEGFWEGVETVPTDGKNLNRIFLQTDEKGTITQRIAWAVRTHVYPEADFILDLHGGGRKELMTPLVFFPGTASPEVTNLSRAAASHLAVNIRVPSKANNGLYSCAAHSGIPAMLQEIGQLGSWTEDEVNLCLESIDRLMAFLGIRGEARPNLEQRETVETLYVDAEATGFWRSNLPAGNPVKKGEVIGVIEDWDGNPLHTVTADFDGMILYHFIALGIRKGDPLVAYGRFADDQN